MKIVIAPDSYKESLSALEVATAIERGFREIFPSADYVKLPVADGGEGTVEAMVAATQGRIIHVPVTGPLGEPVEGFYGLSGDDQSAFIEMAAASGLELVPPSQRNPLKTTSWGTGELIRHALDAGVKHIIIGIGGSATNDGGAGMMCALGARLLDENGQDVPPGANGLLKLHAIDVSQMDPRLKEARFRVACDVSNPLCGPNGAAYIFGPQKGAKPDDLPVLDEALHRFSQVIRRDLGKEIEQTPGAGAAGGGAVFDLNGASGVFTGSGLLLLIAMIIVFAGVRVKSTVSEE